MNRISEDLNNMAQGTVLSLELKDSLLNTTGLLKLTGKLMAVRRQMGAADGSEDTIIVLSREPVDLGPNDLPDTEEGKAQAAVAELAGEPETKPVSREIPTILIEGYEILESGDILR